MKVVTAFYKKHFAIKIQFKFNYFFNKKKKKEKRVTHTINVSITKLYILKPRVKIEQYICTSVRRIHA